MNTQQDNGFGLVYASVADAALAQIKVIKLARQFPKRQEETEGGNLTMNGMTLVLAFTFAASQAQAPWDKIWTTLGKGKGLSNETVVSGLNPTFAVGAEIPPK